MSRPGSARSRWSSRVHDVYAALLSRRQLPARQLPVSRRLLCRHILARPVNLKHDGTDGRANTDGTAVERADGTANTGVN